MVAVDGSGQSFGGLKTGIELAKVLNKPLEIISTFDPYFHYAMFNSLTGVLSREASKVFKFEQQEKLHEDIIDKGLAKIYQAHLEISKKIVEEEGMECTVRLLDGKVFEKVLQYAREENPYLLILGRIGVHSGPEMDRTLCVWYRVMFYCRAGPSSLRLICRPKKASSGLLKGGSVCRKSQDLFVQWQHPQYFVML